MSPPRTSAVPELFASATSVSALPPAVDPVFEMPIGALAPWFGSKRTLGPRIVEALGTHRVYWEPFCGSCAVLLAKPAAPMETVNDLHGGLVNLARVVQNDELAPRLFDRMTRTAMHEDVFNDAAKRFRDRGNVPADNVPDLDRATDYLLCAWMGRNGVAGTHSYNQGFCARYTANGGHAAKRFISMVDSIPAWWQRLRAVTIQHRDGFDLLERIEDASNTAIYLDPPYVTKGAKYVHDFAVADHARLAEVVKRRFVKSRVVVSYYDCDVVRRLWDGWKFIDCTMRKSLVNQGMRTRETAGAVAPEVLIVNGGA